MGNDLRTITKDEYENFIDEFISEKLQGEKFKNNEEEEKDKIKNKLDLLKKYNIVKTYIKKILEKKKKKKIVSEMIEIFDQLKNKFSENKITEKKKKLSNDKNDINVINAIFIEKKINENDNEEDENQITEDENQIKEDENQIKEDKNQIKEVKNQIKEYAMELYEDDFDTIENGLDDRIDKKYKSYFEDEIEVEENEIKNEYDELCKENNIIIEKKEKKEEKKEKKEKKVEKVDSQNDNTEKKTYNDEEIDNYYDIVFEIDSLENLKENGWELKITEKGQNKYEKKKDKESTVVSVIGNKNKGKSFILSKISNYEIPDGQNITTKGLSIIYPDYDEKNIICLDTAGFEVPLCEDDKNYIFEIKDPVEKEKMEEEKKNNNDIDIKDYLSEDDYITQIGKFIRDRQNTDYFLQKFIIDSADILLCIVNKLNLSDQKFLNRIQEEIKNKKIFVIHNLKTFTKIDQVKDYIQNTLLKSLTFKLELNKYLEITEEDKQFLSDKNKDYYIQVFDEDNNDNKEIIHLFMAKVGTKQENEASDYYNQSTLKYIKDNIITFVNNKKFPIITKVKDFLLARSGDFFNEPLKKDCNLLIEGAKLQFKDKEKVDYKLKECTLDELGIPLFIQSNYLPKYRIYLGKYKKVEKKLFIEMEISGKVTFEDIHIIQNDGQNIVMIKGKRILNKDEIDINKVISSNKISYLNNDFKVFNMRIFIDIKYCYIQKLYKVLDNKGIYTIIFNIFNDEKKQSKIHIEEEEEEEEEEDENKENEENEEN